MHTVRTARNVSTSGSHAQLHEHGFTPTRRGTSIPCGTALHPEPWPRWLQLVMQEGSPPPPAPAAGPCPSPPRIPTALAIPTPSPAAALAARTRCCQQLELVMLVPPDLLPHAASSAAASKPRLGNTPSPRCCTSSRATPAFMPGARPGRATRRMAEALPEALPSRQRSWSRAAAGSVAQACVAPSMALKTAQCQSGPCHRPLA